MKLNKPFFLFLFNLKYTNSVVTEFYYTLFFQFNLFWFFLIACWLYHLENNWNLVNFSTFFGTWDIINKQMTAYYFRIM